MVLVLCACASDCCTLKVKAPSRGHRAPQAPAVLVLVPVLVSVFVHESRPAPVQRQVEVPSVPCTL